MAARGAFWSSVRFIAAFLGPGEPALLRRISGVNGSGRGDALLFDTDRGVAKAAMNRQHCLTAFALRAACGWLSSLRYGSKTLARTALLAPKHGGFQYT